VTAPTQDHDEPDPRPADDAAFDGGTVAVRWRNVLMMRLLERFTLRCAARGVDVMALKGAVLLATGVRGAGERTMRDIDVLVRPADLPTAVEVLREMGGRPLEPWVTPDFCPRFYNELEYVVGDLEPVLIEPHVRPFRPLRLQCFVPDEAWWDEAVAMPVGRAVMRRPSDEHTLMHLLAHVAMHGGCGDRWRRDIVAWLDATANTLDWDRLVRHARAWRLSPCVVRGVELAGMDERLPADAWFALRHAPRSWRDRLMLRWCPGDHASPVRHLLGTLLTTPDPGRALGFARALTLPTRDHMRRWYPHDHPGWLPTAHAWRLARPLLKPLLRGSPWKSPVELLAGDDGQPPTLCANRPVTPGTRLASLPAELADPDHPADLPGVLAHIGLSDLPSARLTDGRLIALRQLRHGDPITLASPTPPAAATDLPRAA
jgi:hypothetical protein